MSIEETRQQQADVLGMTAAATRHGVNIDAYYEGRDTKGVMPYIAPAHVSDSPVEWIRIAKATGIVCAVGVSGYTAVMAVKIVVVAVLVWIEQNALAIGAGAAAVCGLLFAVSSFSSRRAEKASGQAGSGATVTNIYQYNNFGGNANQQNKQ